MTKQPTNDLYDKVSAGMKKYWDNKKATTSKEDLSAEMGKRRRDGHKKHLTNS